MELNQTPVRTSVNYGINMVNIKNYEKNANFNKITLKNSENLTKFNNFKIKNTDNIIVSKNANAKIDNYLNDEIKEEIINNSNLKLNIEVTKNFKDATILEFNFDENPTLIDVLNINVKTNINAKFIIKYSAKNIISAYHNQVLKINIENDASANIIIVSDLGNLSNAFISIESTMQKNANLTINLVDFALNNSIYNYKSKILGENSNSTINTLYMGNENATIDLNYLIEIYGAHSKANMEVIGALNDESRKHFKGTIDFKKGCKKSTGIENEFCMLLSNKTKSKALPMLLCTEEDVDGKHSSSVGKVNEKELFYIMSRGLTYDEARKLIVKAKCTNIINQLFDEDLKVEILNKIDGKI
ncbi:MAG: SufD family Fe-S cluster assembly protein [Clostridia bacterium]|nr:SufD family Fe-S cluster assembly protein [Clostridia bacterium]